MALSEIVQLSIQAGTVNPSRRGFGTPLVLAWHEVWAAGAEVRSYTTYSGVAADFDSDTPGDRRVLQAAAALFGQNPRPVRIKVGRLPTPGTGQIHTLDFTDMASGVDIEGSMVQPDGTVTPIAVAWNTNIATTLAALEVALEAAADVTVDDTGSPIALVTCDNPGETIDLSFTTPGIAVRDTTADWSYDDALDTILTIDPDFYGVICDVNSAKNIDKVARWALANDRLAGFAPQYTKPSQFGSSEFSAGADHTALMANDAAFGLITKEPRSAFKEAAWFGGMLPRDPGSATWAFKQLAGVGADVLTSTERTAIEASTRKSNHYRAEAGIGVTYPGKTYGGEWIDVVTGLAWFQARLEERLFALLVNNPKVPYTDRGLALVNAELRAQLKEAEEREVFDSGWTTSIVAVADQDSADRADRILRGIEFQARLAGAIHTLVVVGTVTV